jgi:hypothetical protein
MLTIDTHGQSQIITMLEALLEGIETEVECPRKRRMMLSSVKFIIRELQPRAASDGFTPIDPKKATFGGRIAADIISEEGGA